jgi:hypothetical protein
MRLVSWSQGWCDAIGTTLSSSLQMVSITTGEAIIGTMKAVGIHDWQGETMPAGMQVVCTRGIGLPHLIMWIAGRVSDVYVLSGCPLNTYRSLTRRRLCGCRMRDVAPTKASVGKKRRIPLCICSALATSHKLEGPAVSGYAKAAKCWRTKPRQCLPKRASSPIPFRVKGCVECVWRAPRL